MWGQINQKDQMWCIMISNFTQKSMIQNIDDPNAYSSTLLTTHACIVPLIFLTVLTSQALSSNF